MQDIKYQYAINSGGKIVDAANLIASIKVRSETYRCLSCDNILIPVLGEKRKKHFRHKTNIQAQCSPETYLHKLGKIKFYEIYNNCLIEKVPFWIEIEVTKKCKFHKQFQQICSFKKECRQKFDLTQYFKNIKLEKKDGFFVPDLLLTSDKGEKVYIEMAVTHQSTQEKIASGHRIIEITISQEADISIIERKLLSESDVVSFFSFKRNQIMKFCSGQCFDKNKIKTETKNYEIPKTPINKVEIKNTTETTDTKRKRDDVLLKELAKLQLEENCFFCRHHTINAQNTIDTPIYCKVRKKTCNPHIASNCNHYQPDMKFISDTPNSQQTNL